MELKQLGLMVTTKRKELDITQQTLAEMADVSTNYISLVETGKIRPRASMLNKIGAALNLSISDIKFLYQCAERPLFDSFHEPSDVDILISRRKDQADRLDDVTVKYLTKIVRHFVSIDLRDKRKQRAARQLESLARWILNDAYRMRDRDVEHKQKKAVQEEILRRTQDLIERTAHRIPPIIRSAKNKAAESEPNNNPT